MPGTPLDLSSISNAKEATLLNVAKDATVQTLAKAADLGATTDADTANTVIGRLKKLVAQTVGLALEATLAAVRDRLPSALVGGRLDVNVGATAGLTDGQLRASAVPVRDDFATRSDTFTATGNGVTVDRSTAPLKFYAIQVKGTGAAPTSWDVLVEGSLDGVSFAQIAQHINTTSADGATVWSVASPSLHFRSRVVALTLGGATDIVVRILGTS